LSLARRQEEEIKNWLEDITMALKVGRVVRALNASSLPPKAGHPFPAELGNQLAAAASSSLTVDLPVDRWIIVLEAAAFSPVHARILPSVLPVAVTDELTKTVTRLAPLMPQVATLFGVTVATKKQMPRPLRPTRVTSKTPKTVAVQTQATPVIEATPEAVEVVADVIAEVVAPVAEIIESNVDAQEPVALEPEA
jgi:hypothetical protein